MHSYCTRNSRTALSIFPISARSRSGGRGNRLGRSSGYNGIEYADGHRSHRSSTFGRPANRRSARIVRKVRTAVDGESDDDPDRTHPDGCTPPRSSRRARRASRHRTDRGRPPVRRALGDDGPLLGHQCHHGRALRPALHHRDRLDGRRAPRAARHLPRQRQHEPPRADGLGGRPQGPPPGRAPRVLPGRGRRLDPLPPHPDRAQAPGARPDARRPRPRPRRRSRPTRAPARSTTASSPSSSSSR